MNDPRPDSHVLVVGGTGMLRQVVLDLAGSHHVTVVARDTARLAAIEAEGHGSVHGVSIDYRRSDHLAASLQRAQAARGPFTTAVVWVHDDAPDAVAVIAGAMCASSPRLFHVRGSAAADPTRAAADASALARRAGILYHEVILGFVRIGRVSRWLTHDEIAAGVLRAIETGAGHTIVGVVRPWEERP